MTRGTTGRVVLLAALALCGSLCGSIARAAEVEGVRVEDQVTAGGQTLVLNGAGVRTKLAFIKLYVGALYLTAKKTAAEDIIKDAGAKRIVMHVLIDELTAKDLTDTGINLGLLQSWVNGSTSPVPVMVLLRLSTYR